VDRITLKEQHRFRADVELGEARARGCLRRLWGLQVCERWTISCAGTNQRLLRADNFSFGRLDAVQVIDQFVRVNEGK